MSILPSDDRNIVEAEAVNWRLIVYPLVAGVIVLLAGFGIYYYELNQRDIEETEAHDALVEAKTPEEMRKVADQYPKTTQAAVALISAADLSFGQKDYDGAAQDYQRIISNQKIPARLRDSAQLGLGSSLAAGGKYEDAIRNYLEVAHKGAHSPFAPAASYAVAQIYADRKDKAHEEQTLQETVRLGGDSPFVKAAAAQLKMLAGTPHEVGTSSPTPVTTTPAP